MTKHLYSVASALLKGDSAAADAAFKEAFHQKLRLRLKEARKDVAARLFAVEAKGKEEKHNTPDGKRRKITGKEPRRMVKPTPEDKNDDDKTVKEETLVESNRLVVPSVGEIGVYASAKRSDRGILYSGFKAHPEFDQLSAATSVEVNETSLTAYSGSKVLRTFKLR